MSYITDPRFFNYLIMSLYLLNSVRWAYEGNWQQVLYWAAAFQITFSVTMMAK